MVKLMWSIACNEPLEISIRTPVIMVAIPKIFILDTFSLKIILESTTINNGIEMAINDKLTALVVFPAK